MINVDVQADGGSVGMQLYRRKPKVLRPIIRTPVDERFWQHCLQHELVMGAALTMAVSEWLDRQQATEQEESVV